MGISVPFKLSHNVINIAKKAGFKKINVLKDKQPNIGNWKGLKEWYIIFFINKDLVLGKIDTYFDQEFYSKLDMRLPVSDMRRGQINLKLARSLVNLNSQKSIYDPFVGVGRIPLASMNLKKQFIASDINEQAIKDTKNNYEYGKTFWSKTLKRPVDLVEPFLSDSRNISELNLTGVNFAHVGISTEGYLGTNFNTKPSEKNCQDQWQIIEKLWKDTIQSSQTIKIPEIVLCLPFYQLGNKQLLPNFVDRLIQSTSYSLTSFHNQKPYILYSREKSNVGHMILKLVLS
ncbi:hypothetical protein HC766_02270 [Candidatus Gracilibacteria bacterium]|nr:hypothetical protein [Candidatus Gracilibacteria bacterium]